MPRQSRPQRFVVFLGVVVLAGSAACADVQAQGVGGIIGQVFEPGGGSPSKRVLVHLQFRGAPIRSEYADSEGRFSFYELINNPYHIVITEEGYFPVDQLVIVRADFSPTTIVRVVLRPKEEADSESAPPPDLVGGGSPHVVSVEDYLKKFPRKVIKEFEAGVKDAEKGKIDKAIKHYQKAVKLAPDFYPAHNNLGTIYLARRDFEAAEAAFSEVIKLHSTDANAYFNLGNVYLLTERYEDAERALQEGLSRESLSPLGHYLLGSVQMRQGRFPESERSLKRAIAVDPEMPNIRLELVNLYLVQQRNEDAVKELRAFVQAFPNDPMLAKVKEILTELEASATP